MKKIYLTLTVLTIILGTGFSQQKFAFVDSDYILGNIPRYESAQKSLDKLAADWQKEVEALYVKVDQMYKDFQTDKALLIDERKTKRENEIIEKEKEAKDLQKKYFGREGELYKKRTELVKPIQDEVFNAVQELAEEGNYAVIFDTSGGIGMLYTNPKWDKSDEVLEKLGFKK
ncbi:OmpH family outer membrane protein [Bacteroidota bacterium]